MLNPHSKAIPNPTHSTQTPTQTPKTRQTQRGYRKPHTQGTPYRARPIGHANPHTNQAIIRIEGSAAAAAAAPTVATSFSSEPPFYSLQSIEPDAVLAELNATLAQPGAALAQPGIALAFAFAAAALAAAALALAHEADPTHGGRLVRGANAEKGKGGGDESA